MQVLHRRFSKVAELAKRGQAVSFLIVDGVHTKKDESQVLKLHPEAERSVFRAKGFSSECAEIKKRHQCTHAIQKV